MAIFYEKLNEAEIDVTVGISIFNMIGGKDVECFGTRMDKGRKVGCHSHNKGDEWYIILGGAGEMYLGDVNDKGSVTNIRVEHVEKGSVIVVPENTAHQLKANTQLDLIFICPKSHLSEDRLMHESLV